MGGGDPYLDMVFEVNEYATKDFCRLLKISDDYAKTYAKGITNGFIGIENDLAQLFGIKHVMFENVQIATIPYYPDRFRINVSSIAFDKTQRQREELRAIPGNTRNMDVKMLENNKYAYANDRLIEARLKDLEVYPDLELPTYTELNAALSHRDAVCKKYENYTNAKYVDPDFYFSTKK